MTPGRAAARRVAPLLVAAVAVLGVGCGPTSGSGALMPADLPNTGYPWHTDIPSTTFWVGELFDPDAPDGSQVISTYDSDWMGSYGGCDGVSVLTPTGDTRCATEPRTAENGFFPTAMNPLENPFYLDLPFDDVHNENAFAMRGSVVPWAQEPAYVGMIADPTQSLMKNRWVALHRGGAICYGQIQDAGPGEYDDAAYVFGADDRRPVNERYGGAGLDVSPALNGCLGFEDLDGMDDRVDWAFINAEDVPPGPWRRVVTYSGVR